MIFFKGLKRYLQGIFVRIQAIFMRIDKDKKVSTRPHVRYCRLTLYRGILYLWKVAPEVTRPVWCGEKWSNRVRCRRRAKAVDIYLPTYRTETAWYCVFIDVFILFFGRWKSELRYGKSQSQADKWKNAVRGIRFVDVNPRHALIERTLITLTRLLLRTLEKDMVKSANLIKPN